MKSQRLIKLFILSQIILSTTVFAKHVLPVFAGFWYTWADYGGGSGCDNKPTFIYTNKIYGDAKTVVDILLKDVPKHNDCSWGDVQFSNVDIDLPPFDFLGTGEDWNKLVSHSKNLVPQKWVRYCTDKNGDAIDSMSTEISPSYTKCPLNSRFSTFDKDDESSGCSTNPTVCIGDVVGRDMNSKMFEKYGHIGLVFHNLSVTDEAVIEVLNATPVIQITPLSQFVPKSDLDLKFWGEKYGTAKYSDLDVTKGYNIINAAKDGMYCGYSVYTIGWNFHSCAYDPLYGENTAIYRCDSFVYDSYLQGAGIKILDYTPANLYTPKDLFNALLSCRFIEDKGSKCTFNKSSQKVKKLFSKFYTNWYIEEEKINDVLSQKKLDLKKINQLTYHYVVTNKTTPRSEKINYLWGLAKQYQTNSMRFKYILDCLDYLYPIEITDSLIQVYNNDHNVKNKTAILRILTDLTSNDAQKTYEKNHLATQQNIIKIQNLFRSILTSEKNPTILEQSIFYSAHIFEPTIAKTLIDNVFQRKDFDRAALKKLLYSNSAFYTQQLWLIFSSSDMQQQYLPALVSKVNNGGKTYQKAFNKSLYYFFTDKDFYPPKYGFDPSKINPTIRPILLNYLNTQKPKFDITNKAALSLVQQQKQYDWLFTELSIKSNSATVRNQKLASYITTMNNLPKRALLLFYATKGVYNYLPKDMLLDLKTYLTNAYKATRHNIFKYQSNPIEQEVTEYYIKAGLSRLNRVI